MSSLAESPELQAFARFVDLTVEKRALRDRMNEIDEQVKALEPALVGYLGAAGLQSLTVNNYLVFPQREPWVYPITGVSRQTVCEALKLAGLGRMVSENYSTQSLTKYVKDLEDHHKLFAGLNPGALDKLLPPALAGLVNVKAAYRLRIQKKDAKYVYSPETYQEDEHERR